MLDFIFIKTILVAIACGSCIGLERQLKGRPAGIRTSSLVCLGTACFVHMSMTLTTDPALFIRIISSVISGIGFLGAGVILNQRGHVKGVTSAAVIWALATIGCYVGMERFTESFVLTLVVLFVLIFVQALETNVKKLRIGMYNHDVITENHKFDEESL